jgi:predicted SprT family Zn-dependent metalloprotease
VNRKTLLAQPLPGFGVVLPLHLPSHRHLIFIERDMQPQSIEVTVAHELIHLADRVRGTPRRHRHHGYDSIAADEAAVTGYGLEELRCLLHEESARRENMRRARRPIRYLYECPNCGKEYPRARRYTRAVSCIQCDRAYNPLYKLRLRADMRMP